MNNVLGLCCIQCGKEFEAGAGLYTCPVCGSQDGILDVVYDYQRTKNDHSRQSLAAWSDYSMFRYLPFLPLNPETPRPHLRIGWTPLYRPSGLAEALGFNNLYLNLS